MITKTTDKHEFTGRKMLIIMIAFFSVIVAANLTLAYLANRSWTGLVPDNPFDKSQNFRESVDQANRQKLLGWTGTITHQSGGMVVRLQDRQGVGVVAERLSVLLRRPATDSQDRVVILQPLGDGRYFAETLLAPGIWSVGVHARMKDQSIWRLEYRILVRGDGTFAEVSN